MIDQMIDLVLGKGSPDIMHSKKITLLPIKWNKIRFLLFPNGRATK